MEMDSYGQNLIGGVGTGYNLARNLLTDNFVAGTVGVVANTYDLLAFNAGNFFSTGISTISITTNANTYTFNPTVNSAQNLGALTFLGFQATGGEYIQSFGWSGGNATGITDVQLGSSQAVPEPASIAMWGLGALGMVFAGRKRRQLKLAA